MASVSIQNYSTYKMYLIQAWIQKFSKEWDEDNKGERGEEKIENMHVNTEYIIRSIHIKIKITHFSFIFSCFSFFFLLFKFFMKIQNHTFFFIFLFFTFFFTFQIFYENSKGCSPLNPPPPPLLWIL